MTHFKSTKSPYPTQSPLGMEFCDFVDTLRLVKDIIQPSKESCGLFGVTKFTGRRRLANAITSRGIIFDFDDTPITPEAFAELFPSLQMLIYSSYRHSPEETRYRVCIPTSAEVSAADHLRIGKAMVSVIAASYPKHKIDQQKLHAASVFYLPSKTPYSFFHVHTEGRGALDVKAVMDALPAPVAPEPYVAPPIEPGALSDRLERYKQYFLEHGTGQGAGRAQLWSLSKKLRDIGCDAADIRAVLFEMAGYAHNVMERRAEIDQLMRDIMK